MDDRTEKRSVSMEGSEAFLTHSKVLNGGLLLSRGPPSDHPRGLSTLNLPFFGILGIPPFKWKAP